MNELWDAKAALMNLAIAAATTIPPLLSMSELMEKHPK